MCSLGFFKEQYVLYSARTTSNVPTKTIQTKIFVPSQIFFTSISAVLLCRVLWDWSGLHIERSKVKSGLLWIEAVDNVQNINISVLTRFSNSSKWPNLSLNPDPGSMDTASWKLYAVSRYINVVWNLKPTLIPQKINEWMNEVKLSKESLQAKMLPVLQ